MLVLLPGFTLGGNQVLEAGIKVTSKYPVQVVQVTDVGLLDSLKGMHTWPRDCVISEATAISPVLASQSNYMVNGPNFKLADERERQMHFWAYAIDDSTRLGMRLNTTSFNGVPIDTFFYKDLDEGDVYYLFSQASMPPAPLDWGRSFSGSDVIGLNEPILLFAGTPSWVWGRFCVNNVSDFLGGARNL
ncbi:hypothetical protein Oweho_3018 [Owenweeksia hongkongensis DSM 17368]|uniref:Uncharacterized protein n=2 Tax=Owenweeksia TaxID=267986 RepID=G8R2G1_OWEHD|nr:hypothetical protein Oweho_3018 [Owenweeksia hongkongensis DSM 17368]